MNDTERNPDATEEEDAQLSGTADATSASGPDGGEDPTLDSDPPITSSGG